MVACISHFVIGYIHPFNDGNGRLARALFYWSLLKNGYWIAEYLSISESILASRHSYYKAFAEVELDENDITYFLLYKLDVINKAFENLREYLEEVRIEQASNIPDTALSLGITIRQAELLKSIRAKSGVWKVPDARRILGVSFNTARSDLNALTEKGLLARLDIDKKTQGWRLP